MTNQSTSHTGRASLIGQTLTVVLLFNIIGLSSVAHAQTHYTFTKIADTVSDPTANLGGVINCVGLSNTGTVVISSNQVWRGDGTARLSSVAALGTICPSINDLDEIAYAVYDSGTAITTLVRNSNGTLSPPLASSNVEPYLYPSGQYLHSLSHSGSAVFTASSGPTLPGGIYIGPGAINVINVRDHPQITNYSTASMNDNLVVAFIAFNTSSGKWGIYRGSAIPLVEVGGPVITNLEPVRPVINNSGTVAFGGVDVSSNVGVFKTDDGVNFTFVGTAGFPAGYDRISINNNGAVAFNGGPNGATIFSGPGPAKKVIGAGDMFDGLTVVEVHIWEEALNDNGQVAFWVHLCDMECKIERYGVYRFDPRPPVASDGTASVTAGASTSGTLSATDQDGDSLTYSIVTNGTKGTAVITNVSIGAYTYTANVGSSGTDTFTFKANDGFADSNTATVTVTITPAGACATDITATVAVSGQGPLKLNKKTGRYTSTVTLKNGDGAVSGPISLVLDNLSSNATLFNLTGTTACAAPSGSPYVNVDVGADTVFSPRERATVTLEFANPSGQSVTYTPRALAGSGGR